MSDRNDLRPTAWQNFRWYVADWFREHALTIFVFAVWTAFLFAFFVSAANAEERYVEAWVEEVEEETKQSTLYTDDGWLCVAPYSSDFVPEFWIENMSITVFWFDTQDEFAVETAETDPEVYAFSLCETKPEKNFAYCDIYMVKPRFVDDVRSADFGHEAFHGLFGAYHE